MLGVCCGGNDGLLTVGCEGFGCNVSCMNVTSDHMRRALAFAGEVVAETLWPTRCALCNRPGQVLCARCERELAYMDWWRCCPRCGSAYGRVQCCDCNPVSLAHLGAGEFPFSGCTSAVMFDADTGSLVRIYKDQGEERLAAVFASMMARALPPAWDFDAITFVPATLGAFRTRGFDHAELLATQLASCVGKPCLPLLARPVARDQRSLGRRKRLANVTGRFKAGAHVPRDINLLLVDDVCTTGATLSDATRALLAAGAATVYCATFARA